jgi:SNF2 family DNA or RNA helicase
MTVLAASTGTGKGVMSLAAASLLVEDGEIDLILIACESVKLGEWADEVARCTSLEHVIYAGTPLKRAKLRENLPAVVIGVYETLRNDLANWKQQSDPRGRKSKSLVPGGLLEALDGRRVLIILDEGSSKLSANRQSYMYRSYELAIKRLQPRIVVLSATPVDKDPESLFNLLRLIDPGFLKVADFYKRYAQGFDLYQRVSAYKNLDDSYCNPNVPSFKSLAAPYIIFKHKTDPDVSPLFPEQPNTEYIYTDMAPKTAEFYQMVMDHFLGESEDPNRDRSLFTVARQIAGSPLSLLNSQGEMAQEIVRLVGPALLRSLPATKLDHLVNRLKVLFREDPNTQVVVFTFFGQSLLGIILDRFNAEGFRTSINHGKLNSQEKELARKQFLAGDSQIFLSSDSGSRGVNLPVEHIIQYECSLKNSTSVQRINRISRIDSSHARVMSRAYVMRGTIEENIVDILLRRQEWSEDVLGSDGKLSASVIREMLKNQRPTIDLRPI